MELQLLREPTEEKIKKEYAKTQEFYQKRLDVGYGMRVGFANYNQFKSDYMKWWKLENKARRGGSHEFVGTIGDRIRSSLVIGSKQAAGISEGFLKSYKGLSATDKEFFAKKFPALSNLDLNNITKKELEMAIRKDRRVFDEMFEVNDVQLGKAFFHWEVHS